MRKTSPVAKALSVALGLSMVTAFSPAMALVAYADEADSLAIEESDSIEDGVYTADVSFDCGFAMGMVKASFANALANAKATVTVINGVPTVRVAFGKGDFVMGGRTMTGTTIYLADSYTPRGATDPVSVDIAVATEGEGTYSSDGVSYVKDDEGVITQIAFQGDSSVDTYYLQTGISGAQGMAFPYTTSAGSKSYAAINIDWSTLESVSALGTTTLEAGKNYSVPVALKNASDTTKDSMAKSAFPSPAVLKVDSSGNMSLQLDVSSVALAGITAYCSDIKACATADGTAADAKVLATTTVDGVSYPSQISIDLDKTMQVQSGVYLTMTVSAMGRTTQAYLDLDSAYIQEIGATSFTSVYQGMGLSASASDYDVISSATGLTSFHAKDLPTITATKANEDGTKSIVGVNLTGKKASVTPVAKTAAYAYTSQYGTGEFTINPDDTVSGYVWNEYLNNIYAVTVSDGKTTVGAVPWIDYYGENSTSGYHYNKLEVAMNNGVSPHNNAATVNRFAAFYDNGATQIRPGTYTITTYSEGYEPMVATVTVLPTYAEEVTAMDIPLTGTAAFIGNLPEDISNAKVTISYKEGTGRQAVTKYLNTEGADGNAIAADGSVAITVPEGLAADTALTISVTSDNYAPISATATTKESVAVPADPAAAEGLEYNGETQTGVTAGTGYTVSDNTALDAGNYEAMATLLPGYTWTDGTAAAKTVAFVIAKIDQTPSVDKAQLTKSAKANKTTTKVVVTNAQGKVTYAKVSGSAKLTINKTTGKIAVKKGTKKATYKIKVKITCAGDINYNAASITKTVKVTVK